MSKRGLVSLLSTFAFVVAGCGDEETSHGGSTDQSGASCASICKRIDAAACDGGAPNCLQACEEDNDSSPAACESKLNALSRCFASATFSCDDDGVPVADRCASQLDAWLDCRDDQGDDFDDDFDDMLPDDDDDDVPSNGGNGNGGNGNGGSQEGSDGLSCEPQPNADACGLCASDSCCAELSACGTDCQALIECVDACSTDACTCACLDAHPRGRAAAIAVSTCFNEQCASECDED